MGTGLWRDGHRVQVTYDDRDSVSISRALYEERGYEPPFEQLPTKEEFESGKGLTPAP